uniref:Uncharacterized protein LOC111102911 isoform X1 n=1 Tax=Crassostrea virginica TaxID=6565 RepID=A0A8B8AN79_CRAVI|nr:uncharacterized protein LOC111102911 isoform X1 [Crassostrea virginica]
MQPFAKVLFSMLVLFIVYFGRHIAAKYTAESSLGPCFQNITGGYVLFFERSFVDCVRECKRRPRCQTIRYDRPILICMLYSTNIIQASPSGCFQASREEYINRFALEGKCEQHHTRCNLNETCSLNATTLQPFCEILDCGEKPLPRHAEVIYYVDSKNGSQVQFQCKNYTTTPNRTGVVECSSSGEWTWTQSIQCTDCGEKPLPRHAEVIYYIDSKIGSQVQFKCKNYTTTPNRTGVAECSSGGEWTWTQSIQCTVPQDCLELYEKYNISVSGPYYISPDNKTIARAFCDMKTSGGGWTVIQRRNSSNVNFTRNWANYTNGFGEVTGNYWIGNRILHALTSSNNIIMFRLRHSNGSTYNASYSNFRVLDEANKFEMTYDHYINGTAGDALGNANQHSAKNMSFSTIDRDNDKCDKSCAAQMKGGWWYNNCSTSNLNGVYCLDVTNDTHCMKWYTSHSSSQYESYHLRTRYNETVISIRRTPNQQTTTTSQQGATHTPSLTTTSGLHTTTKTTTTTPP